MFKHVSIIIFLLRKPFTFVKLLHVMLILKLTKLIAVMLGVIISLPTLQQIILSPGVQHRALLFEDESLLPVNTVDTACTTCTDPENSGGGGGGGGGGESSTINIFPFRSKWAQLLLEGAPYQIF